MNTYKHPILISLLLILMNVCAQERREHLISVPGVYQVIPVDLNGDLGLDLIVLHGNQPTDTEYGQRSVSIFLYKDGYSSESDAQMHTVRNEIIVDWGDINRDGYVELVFIRPEGVWMWQPLFSDTCQNILRATSLFIGSDLYKLHHWNTLLDINGDHNPEIVLPDSRGYVFFTGDSTEQYRPLKYCTITMEHTMKVDNETTLQTRLPQIQCCDMNNDGYQDLIFLLKDHLECFFGPHSRSVNSSEALSPDRHFRFAVNNGHLSMLESLAPVDNNIEIEDLNDDGFDDVILSRASRASFTKTLSQLQLYYNRNSDFETLPDQVLTAENFYGDHMIADLNQDSRPDLVLLQFPIGLVRAARFLITRRLNYGYDIYLMQSDGCYRNTPDQTLRFMRHSKIRNVLKPEVATITDWNGDNRPDLLVNVTLEQIIGFIQNENGEFSKKPNLKIHTRVSPHNWIGDLNNDGRTDLIFWYPEAGSIRCLISGDSQ